MPDTRFACLTTPFLFNPLGVGDPLGWSSWFLVGELPDGQATIWCKNIPEKLNPWVGCVHITDDRRICHAINDVWLKIMAHFLKNRTVHSEFMVAIHGDIVLIKHPTETVFHSVNDIFHCMNEIINAHHQWTSFLSNRITVSVAIHKATKCRVNVTGPNETRRPFVLFNIRNLWISTQKIAARVKNHNNSWQMLKFTANASILGFHEFLDFVILV